MCFLFFITLRVIERTFRTDLLIQYFEISFSEVDSFVLLSSFSDVLHVTHITTFTHPDSQCSRFFKHLSSNFFKLFGSFRFLDCCTECFHFNNFATHLRTIMTHKSTNDETRDSSDCFELVLIEAIHQFASFLWRSQHQWWCLSFPNASISKHSWEIHPPLWILQSHRGKNSVWQNGNKIQQISGMDLITIQTCLTNSFYKSFSDREEHYLQIFSILTLPWMLELLFKSF